MTLTLEIVLAMGAGLVTAIVTMAGGYVVIMKALDKERKENSVAANEFANNLVVCKDDLIEAQRRVRLLEEKLREKQNEVNRLRLQIREQ